MKGNDPQGDTSSNTSTSRIDADDEDEEAEHDLQELHKDGDKQGQKRKRRLEMNRNSARRRRLRKKQDLEMFTKKVNSLVVENNSLKNQNDLLEKDIIPKLTKEISQATDLIAQLMSLAGLNAWQDYSIHEEGEEVQSALLAR